MRINSLSRFLIFSFIFPLVLFGACSNAKKTTQEEAKADSTNHQVVVDTAKTTSTETAEVNSVVTASDTKTSPSAKKNEVSGGTEAQKNEASAVQSDSVVAVASPPPLPPVEVDNIALHCAVNSLMVGDSLQLRAIVQGKGIANTPVKWVTSDAETFSIDKDGTVTALKAGSAVVTAISVKKPELKAECSLEAKLYNLTIVFADGNSITKPYGSALFVNEIRGEGTGVITYKSSNDKIAAPDENGLISVNGSGLATITATKAATNTHAEVSASYTVKVTIVIPSDLKSPTIGVLKGVLAGNFQRDSNAANVSSVSAFNMAATEVTREQFKEIMGGDPSHEGYACGTDDPVQNVNWYQAIAFCNKLSIKEKLQPVYSVAGISDWKNLQYAAVPTTSNSAWNAVVCDWTKNGYRLPTEMEWMWAAMGAPEDGCTSWINTTGYKKAFSGNQKSKTIGDYAWYDANTEKKSHPVGKKLPNELGLYDMSGNVWEWCWDRLGNYPAGRQTDYRGSSSGSARVCRGGCWGNDIEMIALNYRDNNPPSYQYLNVGFRVARSAE